MLGEYDRRVVSHTTPQVSVTDFLFSPGHQRPHRSTTTTSTQRTRRPVPRRHRPDPRRTKALHLDGLAWELVALTPAHADRAMADAHRTTRRGCHQRPMSPVTAAVEAAHQGQSARGAADNLGHLGAISTRCVECMSLPVVRSPVGRTGDTAGAPETC